jgi:hypothetical protein
MADARPTEATADDPREDLRRELVRLLAKYDREKHETIYDDLANE